MGVLADNRVAMGQQCGLVAKNANDILGVLKRAQPAGCGKHFLPLLCLGKATSGAPCPVLYEGKDH